MIDEALDRVPRWRRVVRAVAIASGVLLVVTAPWWGRPVLSSMSFFRVRDIEFHGARYVSAAELLERMAVDTLQSVWMDLGPLEERVAGHSQVREARIERRLPGTLVVRVSENLPLALVSGRGGFAVVDASGRQLPIDPSRTTVDLPIIAAGDSGSLRLLAELRRENPPLFERVSEVRRSGRDELLLRFETYRVRAMDDVTAARLAELLPVEEDLARRQLRAVEIDLRYRDQVIARLP
ncbi:MAG TPA: FtsQ-type POTRA domain-containing protein [Gemmatimonadaceae bacterium]|nr:FtsQ-type POTRA domain-containing protein [Gemmatimonadaceae bacterium]